VRYRAQMQLRHLARLATRGYVAPSLAVPAAAFGGRRPDGPVPLGRVVLLLRSGAVSELTVEDADAETAVSWSQEALSAQRKRLARTLGPEWADELRVAADRERSTLAAALRDVPIRRVQVPERWGAARGVSALAKALGLPAG